MITVLTWVSRGYAKGKPEWVDINNQTIKQSNNNNNNTLYLDASQYLTRIASQYLTRIIIYPTTIKTIIYQGQVIEITFMLT